MSDYIERKSIRNLYSCLNPEDKVRVAQVLIDIDAIPSVDAVSLEEFEQMRFLADKSMEMVGVVPFARPKVHDVSTIDAVEVVRCYECKHSETSEDNSLYCKHWDDHFGFFWDEVKSDDFCSYGERKDHE